MPVNPALRQRREKPLRGTATGDSERCARAIGNTACEGGGDMICQCLGQGVGIGKFDKTRRARRVADEVWWCRRAVDHGVSSCQVLPSRSINAIAAEGPQVPAV